MRKLSLLFIFCISLFFTACENKNIDYVKNIYISKENSRYIVKLDYYDFKSQSEEYISSEYSAVNIFEIVPMMMTDKNYNFRICENCFINIENTNNINDIFSFINSINMPPYTDLYGITNDFNISEFEKTNLTKSPLHSFSYENNNISGTLPTNSGAVVIDKNIISSNLSQKDLRIIKIILNDINETDYTFNNNLFCHLTDISSYHHIEKGIYNINIVMVLKEYKGITDTARNIEYFKKQLTDDLKSNISDIFYNEKLKEFYSLDWKKHETNKDYNKLNINITIL